MKQRGSCCCGACSFKVSYVQQVACLAMAMSLMVMNVCHLASQWYMGII